MPAVTIGLPVHNGNDYLDEALGSLTRQTFEDYEVIVSDNASTDTTPDIAAKWMQVNSRIRYCRQDKNVGPIENLRWIVNRSEAPWFMAASHDDKWSPRYVELLYKAAISHADIVSAAPKLVTFFSDSRAVTEREYVGAGSARKPIQRIKAALKTAHVGYYYGLHKRPVFASALESVKRFNHTWGYDFVAVGHLAMSGVISGDNSAIYYQRIKPLNPAFRPPETTKERYAHYRDFLKEMLESLASAPLTRLEKLALLPSVVHYGRHGEKPERIFKSAVRSLLPRKQPRSPMYMKGWTIEKKK